MTIQKNIALSEVTLEKFERYFPKTSLSWAVDMLLEKFVAQYDKTPEEYAEIAAQELKEEISS